MTHPLWEPGRGSVSGASFAEDNRRHTGWGRNGTARASAGHHSQKTRDDAHAGAERCRARASAGCHSQKTRDDTRSGGGTGPREDQKGDIRRRQETTHILGVERGRESVIRRRQEEAHILGAEQDRKSIGRASFSEDQRQRTSWGRNGAVRASRGCHLQKTRDDTQTGGRMGPREHQQGVIRRTQVITHILGAERGRESISKASFAEEKSQPTC